MDPLSIPYVPQKECTCGAACLCMIYRSFGVECSHDAIWKAVKLPDAGGGHTGTYVLCRDALNRGFHAVIIRAKNPLNFLKLYEKHFKKKSIRIILHHAGRIDLSLGHFTILSSATDKDVVIHDPDPKFGPSNHVPINDFIEMWRLRNNILLAVANVKSTENNCSICGKGIPNSITCQTCSNPIPIQPKNIIRCSDSMCRGALWSSIICSQCDNGLQSP